MALALERGSQMQAPLGRAVIGGLVMSTFATLLVVPSIFALVIGKSAARSPSLYPDDPESPHYDPMAFAPAGHSGNGAAPEADRPVASPPQAIEHNHAPDGRHAPGPAPSAPPEASPKETPLPGGP
jgi:hypothetical protein